MAQSEMLPSALEKRRGIVCKDEMNPDLLKERNAASFDPIQLTHVLDGGAQTTARRRYIENLVLSDPELQFSLEEYFLPAGDHFEDSVRKHVHMIQKIKELGLSEADASIFKRLVFTCFPGPLNLHDVAFLPMFALHASDEQKSKWLPLIRDYKMLGCYAQTELGHGSFIRGIETTAEYVPETEEFILNSPTLTATKWWIGTLGKNANFTILMAQLILKGKKMGPHAFLVPIRDMKTHKPLPGITVGDIGPKFGYRTVDNGFLRLDRVRIPRTNMLMQHFQVKPDGTYVPPVNAKIMYGGMTGIRATMPLIMSASICKAVTIAIRYSCVRRQSELAPGGPEPQVLDFQTQQHKLFPVLAMAYAFRFAGQYLLDMHAEGMKEVLAGHVDHLQQLHVLSSGLKAYITSRGSSAIEACRLACGGHGYSASSGLPAMYSSDVGGVTAEGEFTVLLMQVARYLRKCFDYAANGKLTDPSCSYLTQSDFDKPNFKGPMRAIDIVSCMAIRAQRMVRQARFKLKLKESGGKPWKVWNEVSAIMAQMAVAHIEYVILKSFAEAVEAFPEGQLKEALHRLSLIYALTLLKQSATELVQANFITASDLDSAEDHLMSLYAEVRPDAIAYVDAFDFADQQLCSVLGCYDGNVYERMFEWAQKSPLNKQPVHESYKYLKQLIHSKI